MSDAAAFDDEEGGDPISAAEDYAASLAEEAKSGVSRDEELSTEEEYKDALTKVREAVWQGFIDQQPRSEQQIDLWDIYECKLNDNQAYNGNNQLYVPLVRDCVDARVTRYVNQLFPQNGRYVDCVDQNGEIPHGEIALLEHYVEKAKLRNIVMPALIRNGDIEGQYNMRVHWHAQERHVINKEVTLNEQGEETIELSSDIVMDEWPSVEVLPDADVLILPAIADSAIEAIHKGGLVATICRWPKEQIEELAERGEIVSEMADAIKEAMNSGNETGRGARDIKKEHVSAAGIKAKGKWYLAYRVWHMIKIGDDRRIVRSYFGSDEHQFLGTKLNPIWADLIDVISHPVKKISGSAKGGSQIAPVADLQYFANDILNQGADSANYSMLPIVITDPNKNPKASSMILDLAAVWECDPNSTKFATFPQIWKDAFEMLGAIKTQIQQTLSVTSAMIPQSGSAKKKPSQAEIANEQAIDLLTTAEAVSTIEHGVLNPMLELFVALDMQHRVDDLLVSEYGRMGRRAHMERVPVLQQGRRRSFYWSGVQAARNAQMIQQQISFMNVLKSIPPQLYQGHKLNMVPVIENAAEATFGPRLAPLVFQDEFEQLSIPPQEENEMLMEGYDLPVSPTDDDALHVREHAPLMKADPQGVVRVHVQKHQTQMQLKQQAKMMQAMQQMMITQGHPGGGPRPGAKPSQGRPAQQPAGALHKDQLAASAGAMPRKM